MVDRFTWTPPETPLRRDRARVPGAMGGSRLFDLPTMATLKAEIIAFIAPPGPIAVEVGFDYAETLLGNAHDFPAIRWLGVEIREIRVESARAVAPPNCLPARLDARTLFASGLVDGRIDRVDVLFPTPAVRGRHLLWTPAFVADVARVLTPTGTLTVATDVPALAELVEGLLMAWPDAAPPPRTEARSRRERACAREHLDVWHTTRSAPRT